MGIGGVITDVSASVFTKLTPENQIEFLMPIYNKDERIGYSIIRYKYPQL
jgi:hypothetical protein